MVCSSSNRDERCDRSRVYASYNTRGSQNKVLGVWEIVDLFHVLASKSLV